MQRVLTNGRIFDGERILGGHAAVMSRGTGEAPFRVVRVLRSFDDSGFGQLRLVQRSGRPLQTVGALAPFWPAVSTAGLCA